MTTSQHSLALIVLIVAAALAMVPTGCAEDPSSMPQESWACSKDLTIAINHADGSSTMVTSDSYDFKPSWSMTGSKLTFFRLNKASKPEAFYTWRTQLAVVNTDGSGLRLLTSGEYPDFNPTWPRDGSNTIIFNRFSTTAESENRIFTISPDGAAGDEVLISHPDQDFEWANSTLKDGRIFVDRIDYGSRTFSSYLLRITPGGENTYEEIRRPESSPWHKLSISPSETRVAYMLESDNEGATYNDVVICIADFDVTEREIKNQQIITEYNLNNIYEYPRWSKDERFLVYDSNHSGKFQVYAYRLSDGTTTRLSSDPSGDYQFANFKNLPK